MQVQAAHVLAPHPPQLGALAAHRSADPVPEPGRQYVDDRAPWSSIQVPRTSYPAGSRPASRPSRRAAVSRPLPAPGHHRAAPRPAQVGSAGAPLEQEPVGAGRAAEPRQQPGRPVATPVRLAAPAGEPVPVRRARARSGDEVRGADAHRALGVERDLRAPHDRLLALGEETAGVAQNRSGDQVVVVPQRAAARTEHELPVRRHRPVGNSGVASPSRASAAPQTSGRPAPSPANPDSPRRRLPGLDAVGRGAAAGSRTSRTAVAVRERASGIRSGRTRPAPPAPRPTPPARR